MIQYAIKNDVVGGVLEGASKIQLPIGWIKQAYDKKQRENFKKRIIPASLFFQEESFGFISKNNDSDFQSIPFDLLVDESHSIDFDISDHAIENGSSLSDHVQEKLRSVEITGFFTNHSINKNVWVKDGKIKDEDSVELVDVDAVTYSVSNNARDVFWKNLKELARRRQKVRLVTSLEIYDEMIIESISAQRGPSDGEGILFKCRLREIKTAKIETRSLTAVWNPPEPIKMDTSEKKAMGKNNKKGQKSGKKIDPEQEAKRLEASKNGSVVP